MKNKILCIVLAVVIFGSAIGFAVYNRFGTTYDYAKKDTGKFLPTITDANYIKALYDGSVVLGTPSELDIQYVIAQKLEKAGNATTSGKFGNYDTVTLYYSLTCDNVLISDKKHMLLKNTTDVQIGSDSDLARILASLADTIDISDYSYNIYSSGSIQPGDNLYISYAIKDTDTKGTSEKFVYDVDFSLETVYAGLTDAFNAVAKELEIGKAKDLTVGDKTVTVTVDFVTRTTIFNVPVESGDILYFAYKTVENGTDKEGGTYIGKVGSGDIDAAFGTGFEAALVGHQMGTWSDAFDITKDAKTTTYKVTGSYAIREDVSGLADAKIHKAEDFFSVDYTFPADSTAVAETDETLKLAGKTVTLTGYISTFKDVTYDYDSIINTIKYEVGETEVADLYLKAFGEFKNADKAFVDATTARDLAQTKLNDATTAYDTAVSNGETDLTALEKAKTDAQAALEKAQTALDTCGTTRNEKETALDEKAQAYATANNMDVADVNGDDVARTVYNKVATDVAQAAKDLEYAHGVAKIVWDKLMATAKADLAKAGYPKKAVRVAYADIYDYLETDYYTNASKAPYKDYSSFKAYLTQSKYAGQDYKTQIKLEAQDVVLYRMLLQHLVNKLDVELTDNQIMMIQLYSAYSSVDFGEQMRIAYLFDNTMNAIALLVNPDLTLN